MIKYKIDVKKIDKGLLYVGEKAPTSTACSSRTRTAPANTGTMDSLSRT